MSGQPLRGFTDAYGHGYSGSKRDSNCHCYGNAHSYGHANSDSSGYSDSDGDVHTDAYADSNRGETLADTTAASNITAAASLVGK